MDRAAEGLRPDSLPALYVDELHADAHSLVGMLHSAREQMRCTE
jgi:hypothetical protein